MATVQSPEDGLNCPNTVCILILNKEQVVWPFLLTMTLCLSLYSTLQNVSKGGCAASWRTQMGPITSFPFCAVGTLAIALTYPVWDGHAAEGNIGLVWGATKVQDMPYCSKS